MMLYYYFILSFLMCFPAGTGCMGFALARAYKDMKVTLLDVPKVIDLVKKHFIPQDFDSMQVEFLPGIKTEKTLRSKYIIWNCNIHLMFFCFFFVGDFFATDLPKADLFLLSKIVHDWSTEQVQKMLKLCFDNINPG